MSNEVVGDAQRAVVTGRHLAQGFEVEATQLGSNLAKITRLEVGTARLRLGDFFLPACSTVGQALDHGVRTAIAMIELHTTATNES